MQVGEWTDAQVEGKLGIKLPSAPWHSQKTMVEFQNFMMVLGVLMLWIGDTLKSNDARSDEGVSRVEGIGALVLFRVTLKPSTLISMTLDSVAGSREHEALSPETCVVCVLDLRTLQVNNSSM